MLLLKTVIVVQILRKFRRTSVAHLLHRDSWFLNTGFSVEVVRQSDESLITRLTQEAGVDVGEKTENFCF